MKNNNIIDVKNASLFLENVRKKEIFARAVNL